MATNKTKKENKEVLTDKDNPSLCEIGGQIRLRVFDSPPLSPALVRDVRD